MAVHCDMSLHYWQSGWLCNAPMTYICNRRTTNPRMMMMMMMWLCCCVYWSFISWWVQNVLPLYPCVCVCVCACVHVRVIRNKAIFQHWLSAVVLSYHFATVHPIAKQFKFSYMPRTLSPRLTTGALSMDSAERLPSPDSVCSLLQPFSRC